MTSFYFNYLILFFLIIVEILAATFIKYSSENKPFYFIHNYKFLLFLGVILYNLVAILFYLFLKYYNGNFAQANLLWQIINIIFITLISFFIFNETINYIQFLALICMLISLFIFNYF